MDLEKSNRQTVAIFGAPRSGTTWLGQMFNSSPNTLYRFQPLFSYEFKDYLDTESSESDIKDFHTKLMTAESDFVKTELSFLKTELNFLKKEITHLVWKEVRYHHITENLLKNSDIKIIYIKRNPVDVINSWYNAPKEFDKTWNEINPSVLESCDMFVEFVIDNEMVVHNTLHKKSAKKLCTWKNGHPGGPPGR